MSGSAIERQRVVRSYRQTIEAPPDAVFPLLCPVREAEWLDGWAFTMLYSASGLVEDGAVFSTSSPGEGDTMWVVTRHDRAARRVEFTRFTPGSRTCVLRIAVSPCGDELNAAAPARPTAVLTVDADPPPPGRLAASVAELEAWYLARRRSQRSSPPRRLPRLGAVLHAVLAWSTCNAA